MKTLTKAIMATAAAALLIIFSGCAEQQIYRTNNYVVSYHYQNELDLTKRALAATQGIFKDHGVTIKPNTYDIEWVHNINADLKVRGRLAGLYKIKEDKIYIMKDFNKFKNISTPDESKIGLLVHEITHDILSSYNISIRWQEYLAAITEILSYPEHKRKRILQLSNYRIELKDITVRKYHSKGIEWQIAAYRHYLDTNGVVIDEVKRQVTVNEKNQSK